MADDGTRARLEGGKVSLALFRRILPHCRIPRNRRIQLCFRRIPLYSALLALCAGLVFARSELTARDRVALAVHALTFGASPPQAPQSKGARAVGELPDRGAAGALSGHVTDTPIQTPLTARLGYHSRRKILPYKVKELE